MHARSPSTPAPAWMSSAATERTAALVADLDTSTTSSVDARVHTLVERNTAIHDHECINLNPATNVMNPRAEALLARGLSPRASLGHPGEKYEMGLEAIEEIEAITGQLACELFDASYAEFRVPSGAIANLYAFLATCSPGDSIIVPSADVGGHVTHHEAGAAGLVGLDIHTCPTDADRHTVDLDALAHLTNEVRPTLITIGTSLNLLPHPVTEIRAIADQVGAKVLFDAAHACGMLAGHRWPNPLADGAHLLTMSTYKSLGGPASGLVLTNDDDLAARIDTIAYPGLTANFDVGRTAALAVSLLDWFDHGDAYAAAMADNAIALAGELEAASLPVHHTAAGATDSHQLAVDASSWGGGHAAAQRLRQANLLSSAIGLPNAGDGLRLGTPEITRLGMTVDDMGQLANLIADALHGEPADVAPRTSAMRQRFQELAYLRT